MRTVTITNKARRLQAINLPHDILGPGYCRRIIVGSLGWRHHTEARGLTKMARGGAKRCSASLTLLAAGCEGDTAYGLPVRVKKCPDVIALLRCRPPQIELRELDEKQTAAQAAELERKVKAKAERTEAKAKHMKAKREARIKAVLEGMAPPAPHGKAQAQADAEPPPPSPEPRGRHRGRRDK